MFGNYFSPLTTNLGVIESMAKTQKLIRNILHGWWGLTLINLWVLKLLQGWYVSYESFEYTTFKLGNVVPDQIWWSFNYVLACQSFEKFSAWSVKISN
jgi:hypothetical protein